MTYKTFMFVLSRNYHFHDEILKSCFQRTKSNGKTLFLFFLISSAHPPSTTISISLLSPSPHQLCLSLPFISLRKINSSENYLFPFCPCPKTTLDFYPLSTVDFSWSHWHQHKTFSPQFIAAYTKLDSANTLGWFWTETTNMRERYKEQENLGDNWNGQGVPWEDKEPGAEMGAAGKQGAGGQQSAVQIQEPARMDKSARILDIKHILSVFVLFLKSFWLKYPRNTSEC